MSRYPTFNLEENAEGFKEAVNADANPVKYLAIDPGKYNGVCGYDVKYHLLFMYVVDSGDMIEFLELFDKIDTCVYENYLLYPNKAQKQHYSDMETSRVIGRIEGWAARHSVNEVKQGASIKATGYKWIGEKPPSKSTNKNDPMDAHVHFMYWAVKTSRINAADLLRRSKTSI